MATFPPVLRNAGRARDARGWGQRCPRPGEGSELPPDGAAPGPERLQAGQLAKAVVPEAGGLGCTPGWKAVLGKHQADLVGTWFSGWDSCHLLGLASPGWWCTGLGKMPLEAGIRVSSGPTGGKLRGGREGWSGLPWLSHTEEVPSFAERQTGPRTAGAPRPP